MKVKDAYRALAEEFCAAHIATPDLAARLLVSHVAQLGAAQLLLSDVELTKEQSVRLEDFKQRHLAHEPVGRILQRRGFWSFEVELSPATLEPRPDSETLVETALGAFSARRHDALRIADLGTGSGILLIALLLEMPQATGLGIDLSAEAVQTAQRNAVLNHVEDRAIFLSGNWLEGVRETFDLIVSNPPYIPSGECERLAENVRLHDPRLALDGGEDGLDAYRLLSVQVLPRLSENGLLLLEIGAGQAASVTAIFESAGYQSRGPARDLAGHVRVLRFSASVP